MQSGNLFERLVNKELASKIDALEQNTSAQQIRPIRPQSQVVIRFYQDTSKRIISYIFESKYGYRVRKSGEFIGGTNFPPTITLEDFVKDYCRELDYKGIRYNNEKISLEKTPDNIVYKQYYYDTSGQMGEELNGILAFLKNEYGQ